MKLLLTTLGILTALTLSGCSFQVKVNEKAETEMGTHRVVVKPGSRFTSSSSSSSGDTETYRYTCGDVSIELNNQELTVNNVRYGKITPGVDILVDHGVLSIDGEIREGEPMSSQEIMVAAPVKETIQELDGYEVTVRPGSSFISTTQVFGRNTLTVGQTRISIRKDELSVNGNPFGTLAKGDTILVEPDGVFVSGESRNPL